MGICDPQDVRHNCNTLFSIKSFISCVTFMDIPLDTVSQKGLLFSLTDLHSHQEWMTEFIL